MTASQQDAFDLTTPHDCAACHGPLQPLGQLGDRQWWRCQDCGFDQAPPDLQPNDRPWVSPSRVMSKIRNPGEQALAWAHLRGERGLPLMDDRERGMAAGRVVHQLAVSLARHRKHAPRGGLPVDWPHPASINPALRGAVEALLEWWNERRPEPLGYELRLASQQLRLRGDIDLAYRCEGCPRCGVHSWTDDDGTVRQERTVGYRRGAVIVDYKLGPNAPASPKNHLNTGGFYRLLWEEDAHRLQLPTSVCRCELVGLDTHGDALPHVVEALGTPAQARAALDWYRALTALEAASYEQAGVDPQNPPLCW